MMWEDFFHYLVSLEHNKFIYREILMCSCYIIEIKIGQMFSRINSFFFSLFANFGILINANNTNIFVLMWVEFFS